MKSLLSLFSVLLVLSCGTNQTIELTEKIGKTVNGIIFLTQKDNRLEGKFKNLNDNSEINPEGTLTGENLSLEEYAHPDELTGIFEGKYAAGRYVGKWISPDKKTRVPFQFTTAVNKISRDNEAAISAAYIAWAERKNAADPELCPEEQCLKNIEKDKKGIEIGDDAYLVSIPENLTQDDLIKGDFNNDGIDDGIVSVYSRKCVSDNFISKALHKIEMSHNTILLISKGDSYFIKDDLSYLKKHLGEGSLTKIEDGFIYGKGKENSGDRSISDWELDVEWDAKFSYENDRLKLLSKSKKRKID